MNRYFVIYKPYLVLSQFTKENDKHRTLKDVFDVPSDVYALGRLDNDSEGLLVLTNDRSLNHRLLEPVFQHEREYWVQVEGSIHTEAIKQLEKGVVITVNGKAYHTKPCKVKLLDPLPPIPERDPPIRSRKETPDSWISMVLGEGKNRQVRKMTAKAGFPTLRLIRYRIGDITIDGMKPGDMKEFTGAEIKRKLFKDPGNR